MGGFARVREGSRGLAELWICEGSWKSAFARVRGIVDLCRFGEGGRIRAFLISWIRAFARVRGIVDVCRFGEIGWSRAFLDFAHSRVCEGGRIRAFLDTRIRTYAVRLHTATSCIHAANPNNTHVGSPIFAGC